jgi:AraC family transcriptional regulator of adaptative response/methylated-DNA-[protein]-cysteine methyltransferase
MVAMAEGRGLVLLEFADRPALPAEVAELTGRYGYGVENAGHAHIDRVEVELAAYFKGALTRFTVPLHLPGTAFQKAVWKALLDVPFGRTRSYGDMAAALGRPGAGRAFGRANGQNRIAVVVPCHRIVGANGALTGYGGGKRRKAFLLDHERRAAALAQARPVTRDRA